MTRSYGTLHKRVIVFFCTDFRERKCRKCQDYDRCNVGGKILRKGEKTKEKVKFT